MRPSQEGLVWLREADFPSPSAIPEEFRIYVNELRGQGSMYESLRSAVMAASDARVVDCDDYFFVAITPADDGYRPVHRSMVRDMAMQAWFTMCFIAVPNTGHRSQNTWFRQGP